MDEQLFEATVDISFEYRLCDGVVAALELDCVPDIDFQVCCIVTTANFDCL